MKGCPMRCRWCSNPEGLNSEIQVMDNLSLCIGCGACIKACHAGAISAGVSYLIDRKKCTGCLACVKVCPSNSKTVSGERKTVDEIAGIIKRDAPFFSHSNGGVTIGGGEILMQPDFVKEVLQQCRHDNISTAIETSGYGSWDELAEIAALCDIIHYDIKEIDCDKHLDFTGVKNILILDNLKKLDALVGGFDPKPMLILRLPLIRGYNLLEKHIEKVAEFIKANLKNYHSIELLPFHNFGGQKYKKLGMPYALENRKNIAPEELGKYTKLLTDKGLPARVQNGKPIVVADNIEIDHTHYSTMKRRTPKWSAQQQQVQLVQ